MLKLNTFAIILTLLLMEQVWVCLLLLAASLGSDSRKTSHQIVGQRIPGGPHTQVETKTP